MKRFYILIAVGLMCLAVPPARAADAPGLFAPSPGGAPMAAPVPGTARSRAVSVNFAALRSAALSPSKALQLNLFDNTSFMGIVERAVSDQSGMCSYSGRLADDPLGEFALVQNGAALVGVVRSPSNAALYEIGGSPGGVTVVRQVIASEFGKCGNGPEQAVTTPAAPPNAGPDGSGQDTACGDDGPLAVLVLYTDVARQAAGGTAAMQAEVQLAVDTSNIVYANSGINMRMRLAHTEEIAYDENGTFDDHLDRLTSTTDGIMDDAHFLRDQYGADTVVLMVQETDGGVKCGLGWQMTTLSDGFKTRAFAIVNRGCASGNFSFAHEVGHNLGCDHDRANMGPAQLYTYAFGHQFTGVPSGKPWRTVMAYNGSPSSTRVGYFSNPFVNYDGAPTGIAPGHTNESDNAFVISNTALTATNWRRSTMWVQFHGYTGLETGCTYEPFDTLGIAELEAPLNGTIIIRAGSTDETVTLSKPLTITSYAGVAVIGRSAE